jgi:phosphoribosyl 1,2-cyclic phosphate phosphodiesterase
MYIRFLGTGTSMGVPVIGCGCAVCTSPDPRNWRTRTSALLYHGEQRLLIDAGPDFRTQAIHAHITHLDAVLLTHSHFDHTAGLDDLRPLVRGDNPMPIYGSPRTLADVRDRFAYAFSATASVGSTRPSIELRTIDGPFCVGEIAITPLAVMHGTWPINGFRISGLGYITDASYLPPETLAQLHNLELLVINALRFEPHPTHFSLAQALEIITELRPKKARIVHMTHAMEHATVNASLPPGVELAYDGLEMELNS